MDTARAHLEAAWARGYRDPQVGYAPGLALGTIDRRELKQAGHLTSAAEKTARKISLERRLRDPALAALERGPAGIPGKTPVDLDAVPRAARKRLASRSGTARSCYPVAVAEHVLNRPPTGESFRLFLERMPAGHRVEVLFDGAAAYPAMLEAIAGARESIELETYLWASDTNGRRFLDALCIKAQEGVKVRAVIDGAGSYWFAGEDINRLRTAGVQLSIFHPVGPWRRRWGWQVRDHRKLLVVDARVAFTGGLNLGDDYAPESWGGRGWHDVHARIVGPVVGELRRLFEMTWRYAMPETWAPPPGFPGLERRRRLRSPVEQATIETAGSRVHALAVGRWLGRRAIQHHLQHAMNAARERIWIEAAYFVPNRVLRRAMRRAAARGVDVRVIVPRHIDIPGLRDASQFTWTDLLAAGVRIFEWLPSMLHAKTIVIDRHWSSIGSYNLDQRSLVYNWELSLSIFDGEVASVLDEHFTKDLESCTEADAAAWLDRSVWARLKQRFFYFFRLWL